jgi:outer membrane protein assembly factor BamB
VRPLAPLLVVALVAIAAPAAARPAAPRLEWEIPGVVIGPQVTFGTRLVFVQDSGSRVALVDVRGGQIQWRSEPVPGGVRSVSGVGERLLVASQSGRLLALAAGDGRRLWSTAANCDTVVGAGDRGAAVCSKGKGPFPVGGGDLASVNLATGTIGWRAPGTGQHLALVGEVLMTLDFPGGEGTRQIRVHARSLGDGRERWARTVEGLETDIFAPVGHSVLLTGRNLELFSPEGKVTSLDDLKAWSGLGLFPGPAVRDGKLLVVTSGRTVSAVDPVTGARAPVVSLPDELAGEFQIHADGGRIVAVSGTRGKASPTAVTWQGDRAVLFTLPSEAQNRRACRRRPGDEGPRQHAPGLFPDRRRGR